MRGRLQSKHIWILVLVAIILTACSGGAVPASDQPGEAQLEAAADAAENPAPQVDSPELAATTTESSSPSVPRQGLEATDPATVVLASGQPQIVEFFAFW